MPLVYNELHQIARRAWNQYPRSDTLQPTALINEAYLKLANADSATYPGSWCHFFAVASKAMRQILVNHASAAFPRKSAAAVPNVSH